MHLFIIIKIMENLRHITFYEQKQTMNTSVQNYNNNDSFIDIVSKQRTCNRTVATKIILNNNLYTQ